MAERRNRDELQATSTAALGDQRSPLPLYHRIYVLLREQIVSGAIPTGATLPSEASLMQRHAVSRITARRALDELASEGLVNRTRGRGTQVAPRPACSLGDAPIVAGVEGLMSNLSIIGQQTTVTVLEFGFVPASELVATELGIDPGTIVQRAVRSRSLDDKPFSLSVTHVLDEIGRTFTQEEMATAPLIDLILRAGRRIGQVNQSLTATLADDVASRRLLVHVGSPLLKVHRQFFDTEMRCCYVADLFYPAGRFEYRMTLTRGNDDQFRPAEP